MSTRASVDRYQAALVEKTCIECGTVFTQRRILSGICSDACKAARRAKFRPQTQRPCEHCGETFTLDHLKARFCSPRCAYDHRERKTFRATTLKARAAQRLIRYHIDAGHIVRPDTCEECGCTDRKIEAAHKDYDRPLDVRWLCRSCHVRWDKAEPKGATYVITGSTAQLASVAMAAD